MAKYCSNCGHELREGDKFCSECGHSMGQAVGTGPVPAYETCEIKWRQTAKWPIFKFAFYAEAIGPRGMYNAGQSKEVVNSASPNPGRFGASTSKTEPLVRALVAQLTTQGWEPVSEKGADWWSYRFRRLSKG